MFLSGAARRRERRTRRCWTPAGRSAGGPTAATSSPSSDWQRATSAHADVVAVSAHFLRPPAVGEAEVAIEVLHEGRSVSTVRATLLQEGVPRRGDGDDRSPGRERGALARRRRAAGRRGHGRLHPPDRGHRRLRGPADGPARPPAGPRQPRLDRRRAERSRRVARPHRAAGRAGVRPAVAPGRGRRVPPGALRRGAYRGGSRRSSCRRTSARIRPTGRSSSATVRRSSPRAGSTRRRPSGTATAPWSRRPRRSPAFA